MKTVIVEEQDLTSGPEGQFLHESLLTSRYDLARAESRRKLRDMHPGNRLRLMAGLPLLPEPEREQGVHSDIPVRPSEDVHDDDL